MKGDKRVNELREQVCQDLQSGGVQAQRAEEWSGRIIEQLGVHPALFALAVEPGSMSLLCQHLALLDSDATHQRAAREYIRGIVSPVSFLGLLEHLQLRKARQVAVSDESFVVLREACAPELALLSLVAFYSVADGLITDASIEAACKALKADAVLVEKMHALGMMQRAEEGAGYRFLCRGLRDYYAACYLGDLLDDPRGMDTCRVIVSHNKLDGRYHRAFGLCAGLCADSAQKLGTLMDLLAESPTDLLGHGELALKIRCLDAVQDQMPPAHTERCIPELQERLLWLAKEIDAGRDNVGDYVWMQALWESVHWRTWEGEQDIMSKVCAHVGGTRPIEKRLSTLAKLGLATSRVIVLLENAMQSKDLQVVQEAARAYAALSVDTRRAALIEKLLGNLEQEAPCDASARALGYLLQGCVDDVILKRLQQAMLRDKELHFEVLGAVARLGEEASKPVILQALSHCTVLVQSRSEMALGDGSMIVMSNAVPSVANAVRAVGCRGATSADAASYLTSVHREEMPYPVRAALISALGQLPADIIDAETVSTVLRHREFDTCEEVKQAACEAIDGFWLTLATEANYEQLLTDICSTDSSSQGRKLSASGPVDRLLSVAVGDLSLALHWIQQGLKHAGMNRHFGRLQLACLEWLKSKDGAVRVAAIKILAQLNDLTLDEGARNILFNGLADQEPDVRQQAACLLKRVSWRLSDADVGKLYAALSDKSAKVNAATRDLYCHLIQTLDGDSALKLKEHLSEQLHSCSPAALVVLIEMLGADENNSWVEAAQARLLAGLNEKDLEIRMAYGRGLVALCRHHATPTLLATLHDMLSNKDELKRYIAQKALMRANDPSVKFSVLKAVMLSESKKLSTWANHVQECAGLAVDCLLARQEFQLEQWAGDAQQPLQWLLLLLCAGYRHGGLSLGWLPVDDRAIRLVGCWDEQRISMALPVRVQAWLEDVRKNDQTECQKALETTRDLSRDRLERRLKGIAKRVELSVVTPTSPGISPTSPPSGGRLAVLARKASQVMGRSPSASHANSPKPTPPPNASFRKAESEGKLDDVVPLSEQRRKSTGDGKSKRGLVRMLSGGKS